MAYLPPPNPAYSPGAPEGRNQLALVSFLLSLVFPVVLLLNLAIVNIVVFPGVLFVLGPLGDVLDVLCMAAVIAALITGHIALRQAKRYPPQQARRGLAITGLVLGYLSLVVFLGVVGLFIWLVTHPIIIHSFF